MHQLEFKEQSIHRFTLYIHFCTHTVDLWKESVSERKKKCLKEVRVTCKLQALVYNILTSTTAVFSYATGPRKLSANEQFFVGAQTVVSLLQTTQIISGICFITDHVAYASSDKTSHLNRDGTLFSFSFFNPGWLSLMFTCVLGR